MSEAAVRMDGANAAALLALWERGFQNPAARAEAMLADRDGVPGSLGDRNRRLLMLHDHLFGGALRLVSRCPACKAAAEFATSCAALLPPSPAPEPGPRHALKLDGYTVEFRLPGAEDVRMASESADADAFVSRLVERCVLACRLDGEPVDKQHIPPAVVDALSQRIEMLDPYAHLSFAVACPMCGVRWEASLDAEELLWTKLQSAAERLLLDVDVLARTYGWSEDQVLALPPLRRAAYLQLAGA